MKIVKLRSCFSINFNSQIVEGSTYLWHHSLIDDHKLNVEGNLVLVAWSGTNKGIYGSCGVSKNTNAELQAIIYHGISVAWLQSQTHPRRRFLLPTLIILLSTRFGFDWHLRFQHSLRDADWLAKKGALEDHHLCILDQCPPDLNTRFLAHALGTFFPKVS
ncbi:hypothetical protein HKD37_05G012213 [Glycine soja]